MQGFCTFCDKPVLISKVEEYKVDNREVRLFRGRCVHCDGLVFKVKTVEGSDG